MNFYDVLGVRLEPLDAQIIARQELVSELITLRLYRERHTYGRKSPDPD